MKRALSYSLLPLLVACSSAPRVAPTGDAAARQQLLDTVKSLAGRWETTGFDGKKATFEIATTAGGSAVRELMYPGGAHEMTNMYHLDGDSLVLTHYCAGGNQPRMRARAGAMGVLEFRFDSVTDLKSADEPYMGQMTLVVRDANHFREQWKTLKNGAVDHEMVFELTRVN